MSEKTDEQLAIETQGGNAEAFGTLVERYEAKLMRYAGRFLVRSDDAKDVVQDVFIKSYTNIQSFDTTRKFSSWIYRIAHNELINLIKKRSGRLQFSLFDFDTVLPHPAAKESPESDLEKKEFKEFLDTSLSAIDPKYREPLLLHYFEELSYAEIADVMQIPSSTVGVRISRGKSILRKVMGKK